MTPILERPARDTLARFAASPVLLAFDFDGTLAPITEAPSEARMRPETSALLRALSERYPVAIVTGRSIADATSRLGDARVQHVIGNHGMEPGGDLARFATITARARDALAPVVEALPGAELEDKRYSISLHYRRVADKRGARLALLRAVRESQLPLRVVLGKQVINVVSEDAPDKGSALLALRARLGLPRVIFAGDDVTDEDVFRHADEDTLLAIRVGAHRGSAAPYLVRNQREIDALLRALIALRPDDVANALAR